MFRKNWSNCIKFGGVQTTDRHSLVHCDEIKSRRKQVQSPIGKHICDVKCSKNLTKYRLTKKTTGQIGPWFNGLHLRPHRYRGITVNHLGWISESVIQLTKAAITNFSHRFVPNYSFNQVKHWVASPFFDWLVNPIERTIAKWSVVSNQFILLSIMYIILKMYRCKCNLLIF